MKTQTSHKVLIPIVVVIWGAFLGLYIIKWGKPKVPQTNHNSTMISSPTDVDTFRLKKEYRDPFLGISPHQNDYSRKHTPLANRELILKKKAPTKTLELPDIRYQGWVKSADSQVLTGLVYIDGQPRQLRVGDSISGAKVISVQPNRLSVLAGDSVIYIDG